MHHLKLQPECICDFEPASAILNLKIEVRNRETSAYRNLKKLLLECQNNQRQSSQIGISNSVRPGRGRMSLCDVLLGRLNS